MLQSLFSINELAKSLTGIIASYSCYLSLTDSDNDTHPACTIKHCHSIISLTNDSEDDDYDPSYLPSALGPVIKEEVLARGGSKSNAVEVEKVSIWLANFYIVNIADGFIVCKRAEDSQHSIAGTLVCHSGHPHSMTTIGYENLVPIECFVLSLPLMNEWMKGGGWPL